MIRVNNVVVRWVDRNVYAVPSDHLKPVIVRYANAVPRRTGSSPRTIVLRSAVHEIRLPHVHGDVVELPDRNIVEVVPRLAAVVGHPDAAIIPIDDVVRVPGIDPQCMMI